MGFFANLLIKSQLDKFNAFIWNTDKNIFDPIINIKTINQIVFISIEKLMISTTTMWQTEILVL